MPSAPRPSGKARKIAYRIMGKPQNVDEAKRNTQREKLLQREETSRVR